MKKTIYMALLFALALTSCKEDERLIFNDKARVELVSEDKNAPADYSYSFVWGSDTRVRDTVFIPVRVIGGTANKDRQVMFEQVTEYKITYTYDKLGKVQDSTVTELANKAVAGVHYVAFTDADIQPLMVVKAGRIRDNIGIVVLRDASLKTDKVRLRLRLKENADFGFGERRLLERTVIISDKIEQSSAWNDTTKGYWCNYSTSKHKLMVQVVGDKLDDAWVKKVNGEKSVAIYWRGKFIEALEAFNNDAANQASGAAPLREDPTDKNSPLVTFPTGI